MVSILFSLVNDDSEKSRIQMDIRDDLGLKNKVPVNVCKCPLFAHHVFHQTCHTNPGAYPFSRLKPTTHMFCLGWHLDIHVGPVPVVRRCLLRAIPQHQWPTWCRTCTALGPCWTIPRAVWECRAETLGIRGHGKENNSCLGV